MQKDAVSIASYIDKDFYYSILVELRDQHTIAYYIGKRNPYNGKLITTEDEAEAYLQQQAMSTMYRRASDTAIAQVNKEAEKNISRIQKETGAKISELEQRVSSIETRRIRSKRISVVLAIAILIGLFTIPKKMEQRYAEGFSAGAASVMIVPENDNKSTSSSSADRSGTSSSSGSSSSGSSRDYSAAYRAGAAAGAADAYNRSYGSNGTGGVSESASYRTTPHSGYSLDMTVYVSQSGGKIHRSSTCSGMKNYYTMTYGEACAHGYDHCQKCFG